MQAVASARDANSAKPRTLSKKLNRSRDGLGHNKETDEELRVKLEEEIGDTLIYLDLLAARVGVDLEEVSRRVFNRKSEEWNFPERL
jgi:hypothetical protein